MAKPRRSKEWGCLCSRVRVVERVRQRERKRRRAIKPADGQHSAMLAHTHTHTHTQCATARLTWLWARQPHPQPLQLGRTTSAARNSRGASLCQLNTPSTAHVTWLFLHSWTQLGNGSLTCGVLSPAPYRM